MRKLPVVALSAARPYGEHQGFPDRAAANQKCNTPSIRCGTRRELSALGFSARGESNNNAPGKAGVLRAREPQTLSVYVIAIE
jgi:hypothetical protein